MAAPKGNQYYLLCRHPGRPRMFKTADEIYKEGAEFFEWCKKEKVKPTITGLALFLGFTSRQALINYEHGDKDFIDAVKRLKLAVENSYEQSGQTIDIFALKNMDWKDKTETSSEHSGEIVITRKIINGEKH